MYLEFNHATDNEALAHNRELLREGVVGVTCTYAGEPQDGLLSLAIPFLPTMSFISSVEVYENGAINAYVRVQGGKRAMGFIRLRP